MGSQENVVKLRGLHRWELNGGNIETVNFLTYLSVTIFYNRSLQCSGEALKETDLTAYDHLLS